MGYLKYNAENQSIIRKRLIRVFKADPKSMLELAKEIGISDMTLKAFLIDEKDCTYRVLQRIDDYLYRIEKSQTN